MACEESRGLAGAGGPAGRGGICSDRKDSFGHALHASSEVVWNCEHRLLPRRTGRCGQEIPKCGGGSVAEDRSVAAGEHRREIALLEAKQPLPNYVYARVYRPEPASGDPVFDLSLAGLHREQLMPRHDVALEGC